MALSAIGSKLTIQLDGLRNRIPILFETVRSFVVDILTTI
jgi:hypothetical protein